MSPWLPVGLALLGGCQEDASLQERDALRARVQELALEPLEAPDAGDPALVELGEALFFDPVLAGNRDQSCATCHFPGQAMGDGRSLSVGTAAVVEDGVRLPGPDHSFTPRNAPGLWDLGQESVTVLFWDGRLVSSPEGELLFYDVGHGDSELPRLSFDSNLNTLVGIQALFPVLDRDEMRGDLGDPTATGEPNELAAVYEDDFEGVWEALMERLLAIPEYQDLFARAYPELAEESLQFLDAAEAIGAHLSSHLVSTDTPWDRFLRGEDEALDPDQVRGALLFYGEAACATCHSGPLFSDQEHYNLAVRPIGRGPSSLEYVDLGAAHRTHAGSDEQYHFRTPRLRNVALTGPWMHNGAYTSLSAVLAHKCDPVSGLWGYDSDQLAEEVRPQVHDSESVLAEVELYLSPEVPRQLDLSAEQQADLLAFLEGLTSPVAVEVLGQRREEVPSGLSLVEP